ncbi:nuclear transport factor 2 family protein, partial [Vibrio atlanticus]|uniref:nuclear transport factor 2 family protein n=1 Tax=Vibrio atlanticus TaxID=693153 RepID=UPI0022AFA6CE
CMSVELPVEAQFNAYNAHELEAFLACFADDFKGYRMPTESPSTVGKGALRAFYAEHRFNNPLLRAELLSRTVIGNKVFDHELIYGLSPEPLE